MIPSKLASTPSVVTQTSKSDAVALLTPPICTQVADCPASVVSCVVTTASPSIAAAVSSAITSAGATSPWAATPLTSAGPGPVPGLGPAVRVQVVAPESAVRQSAVPVGVRTNRPPG